jgi:hypothetical protein
MRKAIIAIWFVGVCIAFLFRCGSKEEPNKYQAIHNPKAEYVGMQTCQQCHASIYESFMKTGMGQSWGLANRQKSAADFSTAKALVYDSVKDFYYRPYWEGDSLCIYEYRLLGKDTVHRRKEKVSYIVGSGQHTNSHIINTNGYLHQAPITFYTQKGRWDLAPGFEKGLSSRFDRKIEMECITCHNGYPEFVAGSLNKYKQIQLGIDCERCHGPGSLHVAAKQKGDIIDTAKAIDYTIVNPKKLSTEKQNNLCQRCHLQGIAVLNDGKQFTDFMPSDDLQSTMNVFMPLYSGSDKHMIMASHVERMKMSTCYINSGKMSCITCHNPHVSVKYTPQQHFISVCKDCHNQQNDCKELPRVRAAQQDNCITCHMPKNGSIDIPHVAVTDHFIRRRPLAEIKKELVRFLGLKCYNNPNPDARTRARAYLEFYERYEPKSIFLDSARYYLQEAGVDTTAGTDGDWLRTLFLREDYVGIVQRTQQTEAKDIKNAWTAYRVGEAYSKQAQWARSVAFLEQAVRLQPLALDFQQKLGDALLDNHQMEAAQKVLQFVLRENNKYTAAYSSLGYLHMQLGHWTEAAYYLQQSLLLNPDQLQGLINLAVVYHQQGQQQAIQPILYKALQLDKNNAQVQAMLNDLQGY